MPTALGRPFIAQIERAPLVHTGIPERAGMTGQKYNENCR